MSGVWTVEPDYRVDGKTLQHQSAHFAFFWEAGAMTLAEAQAAGNALEEIWNVFMGQVGWPEPFCDSATKYKVSVFLDPTWGLSGSGTGERNMAVWMNTASWQDRPGLAHEFTHSLQFHSGGIRNTEFGGWFWESHAQFMTHLANPDNMDCGAMHASAPHMYYGTTRNRYCAWQFFEFVKNVRGYGAVNDIWHKSRAFNTDLASGEEPLQVLMANLGLDPTTLGDLFGHWAARTLTWDYVTPEGRNRRAAYASGWGTAMAPVDYADPLSVFRATRLVPNPFGGGWSVPDYWAPQRYGYNVVKLRPTAGATRITVGFAGKVQSVAATTLTQTYADERSEMTDPASSWRWSVVSIGQDGTPRYSPLERASRGRMQVNLQAGDREHWLVVVAAPKVLHRPYWDQVYYSFHRYPWTIDLEGAVPDGFQPGAPVPTACGERHARGGGWVECGAVVESTAYVGPGAVVLAGSQVRGAARIEDHAVVRNSIVRDRARVGALTMLRDSTVSGDAYVANVLSSSEVVGKTLGGTAQLLGDLEIWPEAASKGVFYGMITAERLEDPLYGSLRTQPMREVSCAFRQDPVSLLWACAP